MANDGGAKDGKKRNKKVVLHDHQDDCGACKARKKADNKEHKQKRHTEITACEVLYHLMKNAVELAPGVYIEDFLHVNPRSFLDAAKIDFIVLFNNQLSIAFQLKSRKSAHRKHLKEYPHISCLVISLGTTFPHAKEKISAFFSDILSGTVIRIDDPPR